MTREDAMGKFVDIGRACRHTDAGGNCYLMRLEDKYPRFWLMPNTQKLNVRDRCPHLIAVAEYHTQEQVPFGGAYWKRTKKGDPYLLLLLYRDDVEQVLFLFLQDVEQAENEGDMRAYVAQDEPETQDEPHPF